MTDIATDAIDKARTSMGLRYIDRTDNVFTWIGPISLLAIFFGLVITVAASVAWYLNDDTTVGWIQFWASLNVVFALALFVALYNIVRSAGQVITYHLK